MKLSKTSSVDLNIANDADVMKDIYALTKARNKTTGAKILMTKELLQITAKLRSQSNSLKAIFEVTTEKGINPYTTYHGFYLAWKYRRRLNKSKLNEIFRAEKIQ